MNNKKNPHLSRRSVLLGGAAAGLAISSQSALAQQSGLSEEITSPAIQRRISSFVQYDWRDYFPNLRNGAILSDTVGRYLIYWSEGEEIVKTYPTSVPLTDELTRRGRTSVIRKKVGPDWRPTPNMLKRNPDLPRYYPPGPDNPLGTHALYLSWQYYRIHGTNDVRKIGRRSSNGCIGLFNDQIEELFGMAKVGTQVMLI